MTPAITSPTRHPAVSPPLCGGVFGVDGTWRLGSDLRVARKTPAERGANGGRSAKRDHGGYTLVEVFITVAVLTGLLGLMMNLSNSVRRKATDQFTRDTLYRLTFAMKDYADQHDKRLPDIPNLIETGQKLDEASLLIRARANNAAVVRLLNLKADRGLYAALSDGVLTDPWGTPYVFMPHQNPLVGLAPQDRPFFFSAGPDRRFLTKDDNVYGYEQGE
jgi:type II secretory pathway pseudopilin PulG